MKVFSHGMTCYSLTHPDPESYKKELSAACILNLRKIIKLIALNFIQVGVQNLMRF